MWEPDTLRAGPAGTGRSEDGRSGKRKKGSAEAAPRAYGRLTRHERDTVQRMLERRASCREIARELCRSPSAVSAEVASHRFVTAPKSRRGERVDGSADLSAACPRLAAWPRSDLSRPLRDGVAALLQRVRPVPCDRLQAPPARILCFVKRI